MAEYTIHELAELSGVSSRTLRHYDAIGLLKPLKKNQSGCRVYGTIQADKLQQILLYKATGLKLKVIQQILSEAKFDVIKALQEQRDSLQQQKNNLENSIKTIKKSIKAYRGEITMTDDQKFIGLKQQMLAENDKKYGQEVRERWGEEAWQKSQKQFAGLSQKQIDEAQKLEADFKLALSEAFETGDPKNDQAQQAVKIHQQWLQIFWPGYSKEAHLGLAQMYVADSRFHAYFDHNVDMAKFFAEAVAASH